MTIHRAKWMNDSMWSFFSVKVAFRPTQNTSGSRTRPAGLTGVRTVIAVALPSTFVTRRPYRATRNRSSARGGHPELKRATGIEPVQPCLL